MNRVPIYPVITKMFKTSRSAAINSQSTQLFVQTSSQPTLAKKLGLIAGSIATALIVMTSGANKAEANIPTTWQKMPGCAKDIAAGSDGKAWVIGCNPAGEFGYSIYRWDGTQWIHVPGGATRVTVNPADNQAWLVNAKGSIYRPIPGGYSPLPGCGTDIGVNGHTVWMIGCENGLHGGSVYRWNSGSNRWDFMNGAGVNIAVDPQGRAWVVNKQGNVYRWNGSGWEHDLAARANDISVGADGAVFTNSLGNSTNEQTALFRQRHMHYWDQVSNAAVTRIGASKADDIWVTNSIGEIWRGRPNTPQLPDPNVLLGMSRDQQRSALGVNPASTHYSRQGNKFVLANGTGGAYLWCTDYAYGRAMEKGLFANNSGIGASISGNAGQWDDQARQTNNRTPRPDSFVVWDPGMGGAGGVGHVGFVEAVYSDGSFLMSESNWAGAVMSFNLRHIKPGTSQYNSAKFVYLR